MEPKDEAPTAQKSKFWTTDPTVEIEIRVGTESPANIAPETVVQFFQNTNALAVKRNDQWKFWTWRQYYDDVLLAAKAMIALGLEQGHAVNILGFNSPEWVIADIASIFCGGIATGIYTTNGAETCTYIGENSRAQLIFVENEAQAKKYSAYKTLLPGVKAVVQWSGQVDKDRGIISWEEFMAKGKEVDDSQLKKRMEELKPGKCCTLIYTSGTTGPPKGVMLSHDNLVWLAKTSAKDMKLEKNSCAISYLPLSHIAAQMVDVFAPIAVAAVIYFAQPDALKGSLGVTLKEVRPTYFLGVPRVWEKFMEKMMEIGKSTTGFKKMIADWAKGVGLEGGYADQNGTAKPWLFPVANALVFNKVKEALGFDRCQIFVSGAAPIAKDVLEYFLKLNIPIMEVYGMSECTGPTTLNAPGKWKTACCGVPVHGTQIKVVPETGEVCMKGRHVFMGYLANEAATRECLDDEGWLHSGDIGELSPEGFLSITGRIKELIITAGGENIPPVLIEDSIKKYIGDLVSNVMLVGDRKKFLTCLVTLKCEPLVNAVPGTYPLSDTLAKSAIEVMVKIGSSARTAEEAIADEKVKKYIEDGLKMYNKTATSNAQTVQKFKLLNKDFTLEGGELTPNLKLKRKEVVKLYHADIESMYEDTQ